MGERWTGVTQQLELHVTCDLQGFFKGDDGLSGPQKNKAEVSSRDEEGSFVFGGCLWLWQVNSKLHWLVSFSPHLQPDQ